MTDVNMEMPPDARTQLCPLCGKRGKGIKPVTVGSLLTDEAKAGLSRTDGFRFCAMPTRANLLALSCLDGITYSFLDGQSLGMLTQRSHRISIFEFYSAASSIIWIIASSTSFAIGSSSFRPNIPSWAVGLIVAIFTWP